MDENFELESRKKIYEVIAKHPGLHMSKIAKMLNMQLSLVQYHLYCLEEKGLVEVVRDAGFTRYYPKGKLTSRDKEIIFILRKRNCLRIVTLLLKHKTLTHGEILKHIGLAASTLSYYLNELVKKGILTVDMEKRYKIANEEEIVKVLTLYRPYTLIEGFKDLWIDFRLK